MPLQSRRIPSLKELTSQVAKFNGDIPEGSAVIVTNDHGQTSHTKTRSEAWVMGGHSAVVLLENMSGAYSLDRVKKA